MTDWKTQVETPRGRGPGATGTAAGGDGGGRGGGGGGDGGSFAALRAAEVVGGSADI